MNGRDTLLLACGTAETRSDLRSIFQESFNLLETDNSQQTMLLLKQNHDCIAAVLLDITASEKINASLLEKIRDIPKMDQIPILIIAGEKIRNWYPALLIWGPQTWSFPITTPLFCCSGWKISCGFTAINGIWKS